MDIKKLFIANRGEIAVRIARTARKMGITAVGVQEQGRPKAYLSRWLDEVIAVEAETIDLYLDPDKMIAFAKQSGCDAIHPGFGFLSENASFCEAVIRAGLIWIGPGPEAIAQMASKEKARAIAEQLSVPVVPGISDIDIGDVEKDPEGFCQRVVATVGLPVLIKAAYGGGGKGMRVCEQESELLGLITRASSEAKSAFGDGTLIIEKYLPTLRHVEVQVLADRDGIVKTIGTRDCSMQRRHQKIVEEAPAPFLSERLTAAMEDCAIKLARHVRYTSAGTVEYLVAGDKFYFLEMNTRLQVEHPVTEEVYGLDLVQWQLDIAMGHSLSRLGEVTPRGHSVEVRLYAEDPAAGFLPSSGTVYGFVNGGRDIRCELGLDAVDAITDRFDPMVGKLISWGETRNEALDRLRDALAASLIAGPKTNIEFLQMLLADEDFRAGNFDTGSVGLIQPRFADQGGKAQQGELAEQLYKALGQAMAGAGQQVTSIAPSLHTLQPAALRAQRVFAKAPSRPAALGYTIIEQADAQGAAFLSKAGGFSSRIIHGLVPVAGQQRAFVMVASAEGSTQLGWVKLGDEVHSFKDEPYKALSSAAGGGGSNQLASPVPGKVFAVNVGEGDEISAGDTVMVIESMKMEFEIRSEKTGIIEKVFVQKGDQVEPDQLLVQLS